jgi:hypothetical protein
VLVAGEGFGRRFLQGGGHGCDPVRPLVITLEAPFGQSTAAGWEALDVARLAQASTYSAMLVGAGTGGPSAFNPSI